MEKRFVLRGLDSFLPEENEEIWDARQAGNLRINIIGLSTTDDCNYKCLYCYGSVYQGSGKKLNLEEQSEIIDQAAELGAKSVLICGNGEPTVDRDLVGIVKKAAEKGMYSVVVTNANAFGNDRVANKVHGMSARELTGKLYELGGSLIVKMETLDRDLYEKIVNIEGSFEKFENALNNIYECGFNQLEMRGDDLPMTRLAFSCVVSKLNFLEIPGLKEYSTSHNAQFIAKFPSFIGRAEDNQGLFFAPNEEGTLWLRENYVRRFSEKPETLTTDELHCGVWSYGAVTGPDGEMRLCYSADVPDDAPIGNVRDSSLADLLMKREETFIELLLRGESCHIKREQYIAKDSIAEASRSGTA